MAGWTGPVAVWMTLALTMPAATAAATDVVCRPTTLGTVRCPATVPPPMARPPGGAPVQALDRVRARETRPEAGTFIPARRTGKLGGMVIDGGGATGPCRPDALGNLHCR